MCEESKEANQNGHIPSLKGPNRNKLISPSTVARYQRYHRPLSRHRSPIFTRAGKQQGPPMSGTKRVCPRTVSREIARPTLNVVRWTVPHRTRYRSSPRNKEAPVSSIDSPCAPLNIHETISGTIEPDLHRAPILLRISRGTRISS